MASGGRSGSGSRSGGGIGREILILSSSPPPVLIVPRGRDGGEVKLEGGGGKGREEGKRDIWELPSSPPPPPPPPPQVPLLRRPRVDLAMAVGVDDDEIPFPLSGVASGWQWGGDRRGSGYGYAEEEGQDGQRSRKRRKTDEGVVVAGGGAGDVHEGKNNNGVVGEDKEMESGKERECYVVSSDEEDVRDGESANPKGKGKAKGLPPRLPSKTVIDTPITTTTKPSGGCFGSIHGSSSPLVSPSAMLRSIVAVKGGSNGAGMFSGAGSVRKVKGFSTAKDLLRRERERKDMFTKTKDTATKDSSSDINPSSRTTTSTITTTTTTTTTNKRSTNKTASKPRPRRTQTSKVMKRTATVSSHFSKKSKSNSFDGGATSKGDKGSEESPEGTSIDSKTIGAVSHDTATTTTTTTTTITFVEPEKHLEQIAELEPEPEVLPIPNPKLELFTRKRDAWTPVKNTKPHSATLPSACSFSTGVNLPPDASSPAQDGISTEEGGMVGAGGLVVGVSGKKKTLLGELIEGLRYTVAAATTTVERSTMPDSVIVTGDGESACVREKQTSVVAAGVVSTHFGMGECGFGPTRRCIELLDRPKSIRAYSTSTSLDTPPSDATPTRKPLAPKKRRKAQTITDLAMEQYRDSSSGGGGKGTVGDPPTPHEGSIQPFLSPAKPAPDETTAGAPLPVPVTKPARKPRAPRAPRSTKPKNGDGSPSVVKPKRKTKKQLREEKDREEEALLLSPESAIRRANEQVVVFGSLSQLLRDGDEEEGAAEESTRRLTELEAGVASGKVKVNEKVKKRIGGKSGGLWSASARDLEGGLLDAETKAENKVAENNTGDFAIQVPDISGENEDDGMVVGLVLPLTPPLPPTMTKAKTRSRSRTPQKRPQAEEMTITTPKKATTTTMDKVEKVGNLDVEVLGISGDGDLTELVQPPIPTSLPPPPTTTRARTRSRSSSPPQTTKIKEARTRSRNSTPPQITKVKETTTTPTKTTTRARKKIEKAEALDIEVLDISGDGDITELIQPPTPPPPTTKARARSRSKTPPQNPKAKKTTSKEVGCLDVEVLDISRDGDIVELLQPSAPPPPPPPPMEKPRRTRTPSRASPEIEPAAGLKSKPKTPKGKGKGKAKAPVDVQVEVLDMSGDMSILNIPPPPTITTPTKARSRSRTPLPSLQQQQQQQPNPPSSPQTLLLRTLQAAKPAFATYTLLQLKSAVANYGFKPVRTRKGMIEILEACWEGEVRVKMGRLSGAAEGVLSRDEEIPDSEGEGSGQRRKKKDKTKEKSKSRSRSRSRGASQTREKKTGTRKERPPTEGKELEWYFESITRAVLGEQERRRKWKRKRGGVYGSNDKQGLGDNAMAGGVVEGEEEDGEGEREGGFTWYEKILLYVPIVLENLVEWLNGKDGLIASSPSSSSSSSESGSEEDGAGGKRKKLTTVTLPMVKLWAESRGICVCLEETNRGRKRVGGG